MRILHIATRHRRGGAERNLVHTALWETRQGHEVHLAVGRDSMLSEIPAALTVHVVPSLVRDLSPVRDLLTLRALRGLISDRRFDIVHTHQSKAGILGRLAARGIAPVIVHTIHMAPFGPAYGTAASAVFVRAERMCARWTDVIVSVGEELRSGNIAAGIGRPAQYTVIRSPIDVAAFVALRARPAEARVTARQRLGIDGSGKLVVVVASLEPRKRVDLIFRELAPLVRGEEVRLAIAGDGPKRDRLSAQAAALKIAGGVHFLGHVSDIPGLLSVADLLVHAATVEGVPQVTVQALAAGVPVVATEMIGLREVPGATIRIVPSSGDGLRGSVVAALAESPVPVAIDAFDAWTDAGVDRSLAALHERVDTLVDKRRRARRP